MKKKYSNEICFKKMICTEKRDLPLACVCVVGQGPFGARIYDAGKGEEGKLAA